MGLGLWLESFVTPPFFLVGGFFIKKLYIWFLTFNLKIMQEFKEIIERTEDGAFLVKLTSEDGSVVAEGQGETYESALEDAQSKL